TLSSLLFFFSSRRRHTRFSRDWSSDVCSSDLDAARTLQYRSINIDLIYGLPRQNTERFYSTVKAILEMQPERISLYNYMHRPERSEERRVGKESTSRRAPLHYKEKESKAGERS